ncbi:MAG TPA: serine hydrolase domain-containing protein [Polyangia bacterium]|nr:serine hydrolase domain-containing protein [Polyangia bacterium]
MSATSKNLRIEGSVSEGFEPVREAFVDNFTHRGERGGACCIYQDGEKVVDLWGGVRDRASGDPWRADTMVVVHSATKGFAAMVMALAHSRGWLDYDERICTYWPEFAQAGKERITVRQLLAHQAGLFGFDEPVDRDTVADLDRLAQVMARQRPAWEPGERQAYHAISLGFYEGELLRRIDPAHRSLGRFFAEEIAAPLRLDFYLRLPESMPNDRLAWLEPPGRWKILTGMPLPVVLAAMNRRSVLHRSLIANPGTGFYVDPHRICARELEAPSGLGVGTARAMARAYGVFAAGGRELGLRPETIEALKAPATPARHGFFDECLRGSAQFSLGFMKPSDSLPFGHPGAFGAPGAGGAMGYADPETGIGYGYVTNRMGTKISGDPRDVALRAAIPTTARRFRTARREREAPKAQARGVAECQRGV